MTDEDLKKVQKVVKDEIRPVKEDVEILKSRMTGFEFFQRSISSTVRNIKDQQSVMNEKLDALEEKIVASEQRVTQTLEEKMDQRIAASEKYIIKGIGNFVEDHLLRQLDDKADKHVVDRLDNRMDQLGDKVSDHDNRIKKLENKSSSPTVSTVA